MARQQTVRSKSVKTCSVSAKPKAVKSSANSEFGTRKLSARDSALVSHHISKSSTPNKALKDAARKYW